MTQITKLNFPVQIWDFNTQQMKTVNIFNSIRVMRSVATWRTMKEKYKSTIENPLFFLFGDTWGRVEWEFGVTKSGRFTAPFGEGNKTCVFDYYVKPHAKELMQMVESVSENSARVWLRDYRKKTYGRRG